jgi:hypothetical protein
MVLNLKRGLSECINIIDVLMKPRIYWHFSSTYPVNSQIDFHKSVHQLRTHNQYVEHGYLVSGLYPSSSVQKNKSDKKQRFGDWICLRPQVDGAG